MQWIMNLLQGEVRLRVQGPFPERLMNLCAQDRITFWALEWRDEHQLALTARRRDLRQMRQLAQRVGCTVDVDGMRGLPFFLERFRTRYAFLAGLALSLAAVSILSSFIFTIQVTGNETVPTGEILSELRRLGVRPGVYGPGLERKEIAGEALLGLEELSWMSLNLHGTRLEVIVREAIPSPKLAEEEGCFDVVAEADGIITQVEALAGEALVKEGDTVTAGEVLISGTVSIKPPEYSTEPIRYYQTHARGRILARTWRTITASIPIHATVKEYTGQSKTQCVLTILGRRIEFYRNAGVSWAYYDKTNQVYQAPLPGGGVLPFSWTVERYRAYEPVSAEVDLAAAQTLLEERLMAELNSKIGADGQVAATTFTARVKDGVLYVTLTAECSEEIGREELAPQ